MRAGRADSRFPRACSARMAEDWKRRSVLKSCAISRTRRWNGSCGGGANQSRSKKQPRPRPRLAEEQLRALLVLADLAQRHGARAVAVGLRGGCVSVRTGEQEEPRAAAAPSSRRRSRARSCARPWWPAACGAPCRRWTCCEGVRSEVRDGRTLPTHRAVCLVRAMATDMRVC